MSPVVNQTYYIRVGWGITANPCSGGAYVHTEIQLPSFTSLAITGTNKVRGAYKKPSSGSLVEFTAGCPQAPTSIGLFGGLSFDPTSGSSAWPSAFGSIFEIWIPVKTTQPLNGVITGGSTGCPACLFAGTWMIDGINSPWVFPVQGVYVKQAASPPPAPAPYVDYPSPNHYESPAGTWWTAGYVFTEGTTGPLWIEMRAGTSGIFTAAPALNPGAGSWRLDQSWTGLTPGATYQFHICYDQNAGSAPAAFCGPNQTFVVPGGADSTAPNTTIPTKPPARTNKTSATFAFTSTELGSAFFCKLDGGAFAACSAPTYTGLAAGSHTLQVYARDVALNSDPTPASYTWTIDLTKPNPRITLAPKATTSSKTAKFKFASTEAGSTFKCKLDAKPWAACGSAKTYTNLKKGRHTLKVKSIDKAGNEDASPASKSWRIT